MGEGTNPFSGLLNFTLVKYLILLSVFFCPLCHPCTALDQVSSLSRKLAYVPGPTFGFVKLLASSGSHCTKWADQQTSRVRVTARSRPSPPLYPHFNRPSGFWPCVKSCLVGGSDKYYQVPFLKFLVWRDLGLNPGLLDYWRTLYSLGQELKYCQIEPDKT